MNSQLRILLLEDTVSDAELIKRVLQKSDISFDSYRVDSKDTYIKALNDFSPDLVLSDHSLPQFDSISAFKILKEKSPHIPFILVTGSVSEEFAVECMKAGVEDYILKSSLVRLPAAINNVLSKNKIILERQYVENLNNKLYETTKSLKAINQDFVDSIMYAKQIQKALLPNDIVLEKYFPNSFLIYEPKNIVSGDFYWVSEENQKIIIAVADCTGHGVPGALMSVMGINFLNNIIHVKGKTKPAEILYDLNYFIRKSLKQDQITSTNRDGMDIAICTFNYENKTLEFSGANRPLFFTKNQELHLIKGDKLSIGGLQEDIANDKYFTNVSIPFDEIETLYLFTDGYYDQFGEEKGKKFLCKQLRALLSRFSDINIKNQKEILMTTLRKWQGNLEQTDDICVVGININNT